VAGGDKIAFVDADPDDGLPAAASPTVRLRGLEASEALNDATVTVTHTTADGQCSETDMIELTVILATLTFRPENPHADPPEMLSPDNDVDLAVLPPLGFPELGPSTPNQPAGVPGFFKVVEIKAQIDPADDALGCQFDFKRERQGYSGWWTTENGFEPLPGSCPPPMWCDDDQGDHDEDLLIGGNPEVAVYAIDAPGLDVGNVTGDCQTEDVTVGTCMRFREWLEIDGVRASNTLEWHASTEISCTGGQWRLSSHVWPNAMGQGPFNCAPPPTAQRLPQIDLVPQRSVSANLRSDHRGVGRLSAPDDQIDRGSVELLAVIEDLQSDRLRDRLEARRSVRDAYERGGLSAEEQALLTKELLRLARIREEQYAFYDPVMIAIELLGVLQATEAIPVMLDRIWDGFPRVVLDTRTVAASALLELGDSAVGPILERCATATPREWDGMRGVLHELDRRSPVAREAMRALLDAQDEFGPPENKEEAQRRERVKQRLGEFLATPEPKRPKPEPGPVSGRPGPVNVADGVTRSSE